MASLVNSLRSITGDSWWFVKLSFFIAALFYLMDENLNYPEGDPALIPVFIFLFIIILGSACTSMHRNINNLSPIIPSLLSIPEVIVRSICASMIVTPILLVVYTLITFIQANFTIEDAFVNFVLYLCITIFFSPFFFVPLVLYSARGKITDVFRFDLFLGGAGNYAVQFVSYLIQFIFTLGALAILIYHLLYGMLGDHYSLLLLKCILIVVTIFSIFIYSSDLYLDVIPEVKDKKKIHNKRKHH